MRYQIVKSSIFTTCFLFLSTLVMTAQKPAAIQGTIQGASGYPARLIVWDDQISFAERKLASGVIDSAGRFNLVAQTGLQTYAFIDIGNARATILLEPGIQYNLNFNDYPPLQWLETRNLFLQNEPLTYSLNAVNPDTDPNILMQQINRDYSGFLAKHYMDVYKKRTDIVNDFIDSFFLKYGSISHPFIRDMVDYKIAMLKLGSYKITPEQIHELWLKDRDILYHHPDYMEFFNQVFDNYLTTRLKNYSYTELKSVINEKGSYFALSEMIGRDTILRNEQLREAVMLKGLGEIYHNRDFSRENILKILSYIASGSKFPEHRAIAGNLLGSFTRFNPGTPAPELNLKDSAGNNITIGQYRGKYLCLVFLTSNCVPCLSEMKMLESYYQDLSDRMQILAVGLDPDGVKMVKNLGGYRFPWTTVHFNHNFDLTDRYQIRSYPFFILIDPEGKIHTYGARTPSHQFREWFEEITQKKD